MNKDTIKSILSKISYITLGGALWKLGGTYGGWYRRVGIPFVLAGICYQVTGNWIASLITLGVGLGVVPTGYGIDSPFKKFWLWILKDEIWAKRLTRFCCGVCYSLAYLPKIVLIPTFANWTSLVLLPFLIVAIVECDTQDNEEVLIGATYIGLYLL